ncbi:DUF2877 domain-containing protein [candidate division KSB1 bacterium]|nr:MAG: DUF2877 domain-containing protein [candidate division KSB1 bacterium]
MRNLIWLNSEVIRIAADGLEVGDIRLRLDVSLRYDSRVEIPETVRKDRLQTGVSCFNACLRKCTPEKSMLFLLDETRMPFFESDFESVLADCFRTSIKVIKMGLLLDGVKGIKGHGFGFTPSGDDFVAGLLIAFHILQKLNLYHYKETIEEVYAAALSENRLAAAMLCYAYQGRVNEKAKQAIQAIFSTDENRIMAGAQNLISIGATSGADFGAGLVFGLSHIKSNER